MKIIIRKYCSKLGSLSAYEVVLINKEHQIALLKEFDFNENKKVVDDYAQEIASVLKCEVNIQEIMV